MVAQLVTAKQQKPFLRRPKKFDRPGDNVLQMQWVHDARVSTIWPSGVHEISGQLCGSLIGRKSDFG
ncbi:hypothetical protein DC366_00760 [Pelagivirga sediminicola]|uniref:Uncharacterized protein n=1 Tax=Pelagivirga sediminicola TaxID=2170575 RepID=A0A2T7GAU0_9RHOB|nr:hypothetical protein DC366_00760 [Pelagivirga sediminicola]